MMSIQIGQEAPNFKATAVCGDSFKDVSLTDYRGKWVVLFFYPLDFTFVCPTEITAFSDAQAEFSKRNAQVLGVSVDSQYSHLAWIKTPRKKGGLGPLAFPLVADLTKDIGRSYGVLEEAIGITYRGLFVIDPAGKVRYQLCHDLGIGRNVEEVLRVLDAIQLVDKTGEVCPAGWKPGAKTMKPDPVGSMEYFETV
jgi:peroxiredoxin (alkyl hydroperoxide reductase subunit C)